MKILFVRHGQDQDDIENNYGGWSDSPLTEKGRNQIKARIDLIKDLNIPFEKIITSPLKRAYQSAEILSIGMSLEIKSFEYLKEWNKYGVLTGVNKEEAKQRYPELVQSIDNNEYILGAERIEDLKDRIESTFNILKVEKLQAFIVISHGGFLSQLFRKCFNRKIKKTGDGAFYLVELNNSNIQLLQTDGVEFE